MPAIKKPNQHFDINLWTGTGSAGQVQTNSGSMQPDFVWIKNRSSTGGHWWSDSVRGAASYLSSQNTDAEANSATGLSSFNSNGFTVGSDSWTGGNGATYVGWQWKAGGTAVTNTSGSISSQVSANPTAGFSIVTYTANGAAAQTIGHGLGVVPAMVITKCRSAGSSNWGVYHQSIGNTGAVFLNTTDATVTSSLFWNNTTPTSTVFSVGTNNTDTNFSTNTMVAYCFAPIAGYSAFGSYTGNGSTDGPFVYLGFRPKCFIVKRTDTSGLQWEIFDSARFTINGMDNPTLYPNANTAEASNAENYGDFLSNGFKLRYTNGNFNANGGTYVYAAFAESPFKFANAR